MTTMIVAVVSSVLTTLAVHAVQAWRYRPRPVDTEAIRRATEGMMRVALRRDWPASQVNHLRRVKR